MSESFAKSLIGKTVEGIYELDVKKIDRYRCQSVFLKLRDVGYVPVDLIDFDEFPDVRILKEIPDSSRLSVDSLKVNGSTIVDVIKSENIASFGFLCDNGNLIVNDVGEFANTSDVLSKPAFLEAGDYASLVRR